MIAFPCRAGVFQAMIVADQLSHNEDETQRFRPPSGHIVVNRASILKDSLVLLSMPLKVVRGRLQVQFVSDQGHAESGIDGKFR